MGSKAPCEPSRWKVEDFLTGFRDGFDGRGEIGMKIFNNKGGDLKRVEWTHDPFRFSTHKIPCESNCPYMVVTDTLNCRKELEGLVDMEEVRGTGRCPFWPHKDLEVKLKGKEY